jgi:predicted GNAT family acetyltransferase
MTYPAEFTVEFTSDPAAFLAVADDLLAADPVVTTVVSTVTSRHRDQNAAGLPRPQGRPLWWAVVRDADGEVAGLAMRTARTPPHPLFLLPMADGAALALAHALHARGEHIGAANGALPAVQTFADELARLQGDVVEVAHHTRLFELGELTPPVGVPGRLRQATPDDLDLAVAWVDRFMDDADEQAGRTPGAHGRETITPTELLGRIEHGDYWFWLDEKGERVHLTGANPPSFGVARIGPVYTPPAQRRKGYAGAAVAAVSALLRDADARVCLFTDQANPTSNGVYVALGYRPVVDMVNLRITPPQ